MTSDPWQPPAPGPWHVTVTDPRFPPVDPARVIRWGHELRDLLVTTTVLVLLGPMAGLVWSAVAPKLALVAALEGAEAPYRAEIGADFRFLLVGIVAGLVSALGVAAARRDGPGVMLGLAAGGLAGGFVAARVGYLAERGGTLQTLHHLGVSVHLLAGYGLDPFFRLRALGVVVAWPIVAVAVHALVVHLRSRQHHGAAAPVRH